VRFAHSRWSEEQRVAALLDEAQGGQLGDDRPVDRGLEVELELAEALVERVMGEAQPARQPSGGRGFHLGNQQALEDLDRRARLGRRPLELGGEALRGGGEPEVGRCSRSLA
jgi:hypothetical protein